MKTVLITGASGGIGEALAYKLAERKHNLLLVARNVEKLENQCRQLIEKFGVDVQFIAADLAKPDTAKYIFEETQQRGLEIEMLINNAGIGSGGVFTELSLQSELDLIQLNDSSLVALTHLFLPQMQQRKSGTIINVASIAAFMPIPYMTTYAASKAFVRSFTQAIAAECKPYNIHVMLLCPGLTKTNFNKAAGIADDKGKALGADYNSFTQTPEQVADEALKALDKRKYSIVSGRMNRLATKMIALIPNTIITSNFAKSYRKKMNF